MAATGVAKITSNIDAVAFWDVAQKLTENNELSRVAAIIIVQRRPASVGDKGQAGWGHSRPTQQRLLTD